MYPLGGEGSHWHGVNFGREATEEWERTTAFTNVSIPLTVWRLPTPFLLYSSESASFFLYRAFQQKPSHPNLRPSAPSLVSPTAR